MKTISILIGLWLALHTMAQDAAPADRNAVNTRARPGGMAEDSPVVFPEHGALPAQFPPDVRVEQFDPGEPEYFLFASPERSLAQVKQIQAALAAAPHSGTGEYGRRLRQLAEEKRCAFIDFTTPWSEYLNSSGQHPHRFYRGAVHANEFGEQVLASILMHFWQPAAAVTGPAKVSGELKLWHRVTFDFEGPQTGETAAVRSARPRLARGRSDLAGWRKGEGLIGGLNYLSSRRHLSSIRTLRCATSPP